MVQGDDRQDDLIGKVLQDTYCITRRIAEGGMGVVYEASHVRLSKKRYAVKVLLSAIMHMPNVYARFQREAEIASELGHPNIVDVQDSNITDDGRAYIVMEYLEGQDMGTRLEEGPMQPLEVSQVVQQVASALQVAHDNGVVHRDIKPANIFLVNSALGEPRVKVLDFGISKISHSKSIVTAEQSLLGTVYYMSPEQAEGCIPDIDHSTDIFALGTICYQALCGILPFDAPTMPGVIYQICHRRPEPLVGIIPGLPTSVDRVLSRALAKRKEDRYQRVEGFARDLIWALEGHEELAPPARQKDRITEVVLVQAGSQAEEQDPTADEETRVQPLSELMPPVAASTQPQHTSPTTGTASPPAVTECLPLEQALHGSAGANDGSEVLGAQFVPIIGETSLVPTGDIVATPATGPERPRPMTGPELEGAALNNSAAAAPGTAAGMSPPHSAGMLPEAGPEQSAGTHPGASEQSAGTHPGSTHPGTPSPIQATPSQPSLLTTFSGAAGQKPSRSRIGRRLGLPLLILFWVALAVGIFFVASGPRKEKTSKVTPATAPANSAQGSNPEAGASGALSSPDAESPQRSPGTATVETTPEADAGAPRRQVPGTAAVASTADAALPDKAPGPAPAMAKVKHRATSRSPGKRIRHRHRRRRGKRRPRGKKPKQPVVGFDKL